MTEIYLHFLFEHYGLYGNTPVPFSCLSSVLVSAASRDDDGDDASIVEDAWDNNVRCLLLRRPRNSLCSDRANSSSVVAANLSLQVRFHGHCEIFVSLSPLPMLILVLPLRLLLLRSVSI